MLTEAAIDTLGSLCSIVAMPGDAGPVATPALTGTIALGHDLRGVVMLRLPRELGVTCLKTMMLSEQEDEDLVRDAVGEVTNVIAGTLIQRLATLGLEVEIGVPLVSQDEPTVARSERRAERVHLTATSGEKTHQLTVFCTYDWPAAGDKRVGGR